MQWINTFFSQGVWIFAVFANSVQSFNSTALIRQEIIKNITQYYDPRIPPSVENDEPITDIVQMYITSISNINDAAMDFTVSMFLRQSWYDKRLTYDSIPDIERLELSTRVMEDIWVPDLYFLNEKKGTFHDVTVPNKLMHVYPDGRIFYSMRVTGTYSCSMYLHKYPLDRQICQLRLESYGYTAETLKIRWNSVPLEFDPSISLPQFDLGKSSFLICDSEYSQILYTCVAAKLELHRKYGYHITQIFIPSVLIIFLSWVSFWLNIDAVPARVSLGLLTVLTITTQSSGARASLPPVSYVKAIDVWMAVCLVFVFAALVEFAYVNVLSRVDNRNKSHENGVIKSSESQISVVHKASNVHEEKSSDSYSIDAKDEKETDVQITKRRRESARVVDKVARVAFPLTFFIFNIVFWITYIVWEPNDLDSL